MFQFQEESVPLHLQFQIVLQQTTKFHLCRHFFIQLHQELVLLDFFQILQVALQQTIKFLLKLIMNHFQEELAGFLFLYTQIVLRQTIKSLVHLLIHFPIQQESMPILLLLRFQIVFLQATTSLHPI